MKDKKSWFNQKTSVIPKDVLTEVELSADIISRVDFLIKAQGITQRELAHRMGRSEAVISRWTTGFPNLTLRSIAELSTALGAPIISVEK